MPQSRPSFPRRFDLLDDDDDDNDALPPPRAAVAARAAAGLGGGMGGGLAAARAAAAAGLPLLDDDGELRTNDGWALLDGVGVGGAGGVGLARPPPLPARAPPGMGGIQAAVPIGGGGAAGTARPPPPRYVRRSSFSGPSTNNPLLARNPSSPDLPSLRGRGEGEHASSSRPSDDDDCANAGGGAVVPSAPPKMTMRIHRHLADQHLFGSPAVNDENGAMSAGELMPLFHAAVFENSRRDANFCIFEFFIF